MDVIGYSERGVLNSLFYEIKYHTNKGLVNELLDLALFPYLSKPDFKIDNPEIYIDQSFSHFGSSDLLILGQMNKKKIRIFIEAKVITEQQQKWSLNSKCDYFSKTILPFPKRKCFTHFLVQLYFKFVLFQESNKPMIDKGIRFDNWSSRKERKIGKNKIVLKAFNKIKKVDNDQAFYIAILPTSHAEVKKSFTNNFKNDVRNATHHHFDLSNFGVISWKDINDFIEKYNLAETREVLKWNEGQIFK